jgi:hypothetical protein
MTHIPSKEAMIAAVRKSNCPNLKCLPLEVMKAEDIYSHLVAAKCPCLQRLLRQTGRDSGDSADPSSSAHRNK